MPGRGTGHVAKAASPPWVLFARLLGLRVGEASNPGPCKLASVNVTPLGAVMPAMLKLDWDVLFVQESNIDGRSSRCPALMGHLRKANVALYRGVREEGKCKVALLVRNGSFRPEGPLRVGPASRSLCGT